MDVFVAIEHPRGHFPYIVLFGGTGDFFHDKYLIQIGEVEQNDADTNLLRSTVEQFGFCVGGQPLNTNVLVFSPKEGEEDGLVSIL